MSYGASTTSMNTRLTVLAALALSVPIILRARAYARRLRRRAQIPPQYERVLILGASSGIGRALAAQYAARGARVCLVGRRPDELADAAEECRGVSGKAGHAEYQAGGRRVLAVEADITSVDEMVRVRDTLETEWRGLDTLVITAGVSALQPLLAIAGLERAGKAFVPPQAGVEDIQRTVDVTHKATQGNFLGPLVAAVTLIPILQSTSPSPSILLLSSLAAVIPAPTRSLYGATKAASLQLFRSLALEHPLISFSFMIPSTIEGSFRKSAVDDASAVVEDDPDTHGLKREYVARKCIRAVDEAAQMVFLPAHYVFSQPLSWLVPWYIEGRARTKYHWNYTE